MDEEKTTLRTETQVNLKIREEQATTDIANRKREWRSFCFKLDSEASKFFAKLLISLVVTSLCFYQLVNVEDCGSQHMYSGLLGIILGAYFSALI